ncbi:hypothetical protein E4U60_004502 [Claviceps pazoutovae]|uniref:Carboxylesterase type B domain-containing protein n=1 Tax=Claviceps pazoutovae TaxID=1649127 RepID=A0A9P7M8M2_9HYPO|nr:hypothetical protein E4U60_004502 [Claviceps pazoutovae]
MMISSTILSLVLHAAVGTAVPSTLHNRESSTTAKIDSGIIVGTSAVEPDSQATVIKYLGVPFGAPPERFKPPRRPDPWTSPYDASNYKPACIQKFDYPEPMRNLTMQWFSSPPSPAGESEDCLNLNVFVPASKGSSPKPVMFWLFGGAFSFGTGSLPAYDGTSFAANQDVIVVTSNYRTNVFGFPGSPELSRSEQNLGWLDQRLALDWVQRNIAALGGDPGKVTIVGESAGAGSVDALVTAPPQPVPFRAAIMQSGQASISVENNSSAVSWQKLTKLANCAESSALKCLGALPVDQLRDLVERQSLPFFPVHDGGVTFADKPRVDRLRSSSTGSSIARVPVMIGTNAEEGLTFVYGKNDSRKFLQDSLPNANALTINLALGLYPKGTRQTQDGFHQLGLIDTEITMQCPARALARDNQKVDIQTWRYYFEASFPNTEIFDHSGAWHSSEIRLIFGTYPREGATALQVDLSRRMQTAWANFIKDPQKGPGWAQSPSVAFIGKAARDTGNGQNAKAASDPIVSGSALYLDRRCFLLDGAYDKLSGV